MSFKENLNRFKPRKEQRQALEFVDRSHKENPNNKFYLLDLPVGVGKSHLAIMLTDWYRKNVQKASRVDIITNSKILQNQYSEEYDSISDLKGKSNYSCKSYNCSCEQGMEFNKLNKTECEDCPYEDAKSNFITSGLSLTNFYLNILYHMYPGKTMERRNASVLIIDECHEFDDIMSDFVSIKATEGILRKFKLPNGDELIKELKSVVTIDNYVRYLGVLLGDLIETLDAMDQSMEGSPTKAKKDKRSLKLSTITGTENKDIKTMALMNDITRFTSKIEMFLKEYKENPDNWVLESSYNKKTKEKELSIEPIWAYDYLEKHIFSKYDMVFMMSGTILNRDMFSRLNGLDREKSAYYSIASPFNPKNRPIIYMPLGKMSYNKKHETFKKYIPYIKKILKKYKNKKGIIHTNSFELSKWIEESIKDPRLIFPNSKNKDDMLKYHKETTKPTVLVSPSMSTGVSFSNDQARFQVIAKVPYPSLASQKNKARKSNDPEWYAWKTSTSLQQACGRIVRSYQDYGDTIILDGSFGDVMRYGSHLLPDWFQRSIRKVNVS